MPSNKLPREIVDHWPEVFNDVEIKAVPIEYVESLHVHFEDGKIWDIAIDPAALHEKDELLGNTLEETLEMFFEEYEDQIVNVEFKLNTDKVIEDIKAKTASFLKQQK